MTMHVNLSPEMKGYIKSKVASGFYGNATEVICDAILYARVHGAHDTIGYRRHAQRPAD